jgi:hypothetical protein
MLTQIVGNVAHHRDGRDGVQARVHPDAAGAPDEQGAGEGVWCIVGAPGWVLKQRFESDVSGDLDAGSVGASAGVRAEVGRGSQHWCEQEEVSYTQPEPNNGENVPAEPHRAGDARTA